MGVVVPGAQAASAETPAPAPTSRRSSRRFIPARTLAGRRGRCNFSLAEALSMQVGLQPLALWEDVVTETRIDRRTFLAGVGTAAVAVACGPGRPAASTAPSGAAASAGAGTALPPMPKSPISFSVIDVAGQLQLTKTAIEDYGAKNAQFVSGINFQTATAPELPAKLKAQQQANNVQL